MLAKEGGEKFNSSSENTEKEVIITYGARRYELGGCLAQGKF